MPQRVSDADVKAIIATTLNTQPFIQAASLVIDAHLATAGWSEPLARELERWLAAHFVSVREVQATSRQIGRTTVRYDRGKLGTGLAATPFGQQVAVLDGTGRLLQVLSAKPATFEVF